MAAADYFIFNPEKLVDKYRYGILLKPDERAPECAPC
jgi:hypothetical protein